MSVALVPPDSIVGRAGGVPPSFVCSCTDGAFEAAWVRVAGELDIATAPELERTLREAQSRARLVVLDLRELSFTDSSWLHAVVGASARGREADGRLVLLRAPPDVDRTFGNDQELRCARDRRHRPDRAARPCGPAFARLAEPAGDWRERLP